MFDSGANARPQLLSLFTALPALGDSFCRFLRVSGRPILTQIPSFWVVLGRGLDAGFVAIYGGRGLSGLTLAMLGNRILSLFTVLKHPICHAWEGLEITFCRFLRCPWALVPCLGRLGNYALSFLRFLR